MSKSAVRSNLTVFASDVEAVINAGFPYVLGETNSIACHGAPGVSNTAGAALWVIDYTLQAAVQRMTETFFHEGLYSSPPQKKWVFLLNIEPVCLQVSDLNITLYVFFYYQKNKVHTIE